jgi:glycosyltransferase involved in cell wall biosynthesis
VSASPDASWPTFSLILATLGEAQYVERFLESLLTQGDASLELIVVDQNVGDHVQKVLQRFRSHFPVRTVRTRPGLSYARNCGIPLASGRIIAFPDDDCWYRPGLLADVERRLLDPTVAGLTCRCTDEHGNLAAGGDDRSTGLVSRRNVWRRGVSATMFLRREVVDHVGHFNETLGLGSGTMYQSGEETDYLLRVLRLGYSIAYDPQLAVYHPLPPRAANEGATAKARAYGLGMGRVLWMHGYSPLAVGWFVLQPLLGAAHAALNGDLGLAKVRIERALGRLQGWRSGFTGSPNTDSHASYARRMSKVEAAKCQDQRA